MESFGVQCPCPEVFAMLESIAAKHGYTYADGEPIPHPTHHAKANICFRPSAGHIRCGNVAVVDGKIQGQFDTYKIISIEAAIAELTKPRPKPITIAGKTLSFPGDGSIKLSGGETISAEVCDEIERRRKPKSLYRTLDKLLYRPRTDGGGNGWQVFDERQWINSINDHAALPTEEITEAEARRRFPEAFKEAK